MSGHESLTFDALLEVLESIPKPEWVAYTFSPRARALIRSAMPELNPHEFLGPLCGVEVQILSKQQSGILQWKNKEMMQTYIAGLEAGVYLIEQNMLDHCERIDEAMWPDVLQATA